jgi:hypothetical protein
VLDLDGNNIECLYYQPLWLSAIQAAPSLVGATVVAGIACKAYSHIKLLYFHQGAGSLGVFSRARMISLSACLGRQLPDGILGIYSANLLIGWGGKQGWGL